MAAFLRQGKKIVAIGRNYADHVKELNNAIPKEPFFFLKPTSSYLPSGGQVLIPRGITAHHEVELGLVIGKPGRDIAPADAHAHIAGYALAVDMTARNLQDEVKRKGLPWSAVKGFDTFTPVSAFVPAAAVRDAQNLALWLKINGALRQSGNTQDMIFAIPRLVAHISSIMTLEEGDLVLTGTPSGIGRIHAGDEIECGLDDPATGKELARLQFGAVDRTGGYFYQPS
ncbi:hypothetical protein PHLGIDRAFT_23360 [Phlebiopsis gigantea 11061_1 CR5-6]|uniref:Fumarylacetoacetase-like C-terminal domain-containing protein n=1 Tax=Phlebiopsis gigantea (strain 11061_1 CR5-6) TaxID=745531 RepID=A0A0C3S9Z9_PHLG1|nr:hypothetical protein PHLGIDRAFT_23360 [Phlebiopsis gigantea 11061_1 CR5-6]